LVFIKPGYQNINNTFVLGENDGQISSATSTQGVAQASPGFVIDQKGSGNILQLQQNGIDKIVVDNSGSAILYGTENSTSSVLSVVTASTTVFSISVKGDLTAKGKITVGHDTAGTAKILAGQNQVTVTFENPYPSIPKVVVTAQGLPNFFYGVTQKDQYSFTITTSQPVPADFTFDWVALNQPDDTGSGQSSQNLSVVQLGGNNNSGGSGGGTPPTAHHGNRRRWLLRAV
jgi:hypothetical protein